MSRPQLSLAQLHALPETYRTTISEEHLDLMGHMNVRWYLAFFDEAGWNFFQTLGMTEAYYRENDAGGFALKQLIHYLAEVRLGETISVRPRLIGRSPKRIHLMYFMVNETTGKLAATMEGLGSHADLKSRRTSPYPAHIATRIDEVQAQHDALEWEAPISGAISA
jgi:acyl-CoA thioester hydrolase